MDVKKKACLMVILLGLFHPAGAQAVKIADSLYFERQLKSVLENEDSVWFGDYLPYVLEMAGTEKSPAEIASFFKKQNQLFFTDLSSFKTFVALTLLKRRMSWLVPQFIKVILVGQEAAIQEALLEWDPLSLVRESSRE